MRYFADVLLNKPGFGTRCMADEPLEWVLLYKKCHACFRQYSDKASSVDVHASCNACIRLYVQYIRLKGIFVCVNVFLLCVCVYVYASSLVSSMCTIVRCTVYSYILYIYIYIIYCVFVTECCVCQCVYIWYVLHLSSLSWQGLPLQQHHHWVGDGDGEPGSDWDAGGPSMDGAAALARLPVQHGLQAHHAASLPRGSWRTAPATGYTHQALHTHTRRHASCTNTPIRMWV